MRRRIKKFISHIWSVIRLPEMTILPGQLAFFFVLSVVPTLTIISYGAALLNLSSDFISNFLSQAFSPAIAGVIMPTTGGLNLGLKFFIFLCIALFIASNGADSIIVTSNTIYDIPNGNYFKRRVKAIIMTFFIVLLFLFIIVVPVFGNKIVELIKNVNLNEAVTKNIELIFIVLRSPLSWFIMFFFIKIIYTMAPNRKVSSYYVNYGSIFTTVFWTIATSIYSYWITRFANYNAFYGGLANLVILMLWIYILAYIFVIGMALNYQQEELAKTANIKME